MNFWQYLLVPACQGQFQEFIFDALHGPLPILLCPALPYWLIRVVKIIEKEEKWHLLIYLFMSLWLCSLLPWWEIRKIWRDMHPVLLYPYRSTPDWWIYRGHKGHVVNSYGFFYFVLQIFSHSVEMCDAWCQAYSSNSVQFLWKVCIEAPSLFMVYEIFTMFSCIWYHPCIMCTCVW